MKKERLADFPLNFAGDRYQVLKRGAATLRIARTPRRPLTQLLGAIRDAASEAKCVARPFSIASLKDGGIGNIEWKRGGTADVARCSAAELAKILDESATLVFRLRGARELWGTLFAQGVDPCCVTNIASSLGKTAWNSGSPTDDGGWSISLMHAGDDCLVTVRAVPEALDEFFARAAAECAITGNTRKFLENLDAQRTHNWSEPPRKAPRRTPRSGRCPGATCRNTLDFDDPAHWNGERCMVCGQRIEWVD